MFYGNKIMSNDQIKIGNIYKYIPQYNLEVTMGYHMPFLKCATAFLIFTNPNPVFIICPLRFTELGDMTLYVGSNCDQEGGEMDDKELRPQEYVEFKVLFDRKEKIKQEIAGYRSSRKEILKAANMGLLSMSIEDILSSHPNSSYDYVTRTAEFFRFFKPYELMQPGNENQDIELIINGF